MSRRIGARWRGWLPLGRLRRMLCLGRRGRRFWFRVSIFGFLEFCWRRGMLDICYGMPYAELSDAVTPVTARRRDRARALICIVGGILIEYL